MMALCLMQYCWSVLELRTVMCRFHMADTAYKTISSPLEGPLQQEATVVLVCERTPEGWCLLIQAIVSFQCNVFVEPNMLPILYQPHYHLSLKIPCRIVWVVPLVLVPNPKRSLDGIEHTVPISLDLKIEKKIQVRWLKYRRW